MVLRPVPLRFVGGSVRARPMRAATRGKDMCDRVRLSSWWVLSPPSLRRRGCPSRCLQTTSLSHLEFLTKKAAVLTQSRTTGTQSPGTPCGPGGARCVLGTESLGCLLRPLKRQRLVRTDVGNRVTSCFYTAPFLAIAPQDREPLWSAASSPGKESPAWVGRVVQAPHLMLCFSSQGGRDSRSGSPMARR